MLIGLISDTHIPDHAKALPDQLKEALLGVDLILHGGDIYSVSVLDELEQIAPVLAAEGDDDFSITAKDRRVKYKHILDIDGINIWLIHQKPESLPDITKEVPRLNESPDVIVFGHTHSAIVEKQQDILLVNPGSPTFPHYRLELGTVGLLTIDSGKVEAKIIQLQ
jgi:putative phosphoesterase